jgi:hypothetical protein
VSFREALIVGDSVFGKAPSRRLVNRGLGHFLLERPLGQSIANLSNLAILHPQLWPKNFIAHKGRTLMLERLGLIDRSFSNVVFVGIALVVCLAASACSGSVSPTSEETTSAEETNLPAYARDLKP